MPRTNPQTADAATRSTRAPLRDLTLIGIFSGPSGAHVLVRLETGEIVRVDTATPKDNLSLMDTGDGWALVRRDETIHRLTLA